MMTIRFARLVRTSGSDSYVMFDSDKRLGYVHAHYSSCTNVDILIEHAPEDVDYNIIFDSVHGLCESIDTEDYIYKIFTVTEYEAGSNSVNYDDMPPTRKDITNLTKEVARQSGKYKKAAGHLYEHAAQDYFKANGYDVENSTDKQDKEKIDFIAYTETYVAPSQVKSGELSTKTIRKCINSMRNEDRVLSLQQEGRDIVYAFIAKRFPLNANIIRIRLEAELSAKILFITHEEVLEVAKRYRHALSE